MTIWSDIASLVFISVTANHLGLISAIEELLEKKLPVINCSKCLSCWSVFTFLIVTGHNVITSFAMSLFSSYLAVWLELFEGYIDMLYTKLYTKLYTDYDEKIYSDTSDDTPSAIRDESDSDSSVS